VMRVQQGGRCGGGSKCLAVVRLAEQAGLFAGLPPDPHVAFAVGPPGGCMQTKAIDRPASPFIGQCTQVATTQQAQQPYGRPWHTVATGFPMPHRMQRNSEVRGAGLAAQGTTVAQFKKVRGGDVTSGVRGGVWSCFSLDSIILHNIHYAKLRKVRRRLWLIVVTQLTVSSKQLTLSYRFTASPFGRIGLNARSSGI
jgi:hypothetical protein